MTLVASSATPSVVSTPTPRIVSGMRPTGRMHLGHYQGALKNWIALSDAYDCFFFSADWHALTTHYRDASIVRESEREMIADWIAAGLDPAKVTLFKQSAVKQHAELFLLLGMVTPLGWLERVPTYKEQKEQLADRDLNMLGFLGYPVLQTADIAAYGAQRVPVGQDQVSHLELAREVVRRFNSFYGPVLVEPQPLVTPTPKVLGTDGRKMSKSYGNAIELGEAEDSARKKIMGMVTDPARVRRQDPGNPDVCGIYYLHKGYSSAERVATVDRECRTAGIGCVDCKKWLLEGLLPSLEKHRAARADLEKQPELVQLTLERGNKRAAEVAETTLQHVREAMKLQ